MVRTTTIAAAALAVTATLTACGSSQHSVPVSAGGSTSATPSPSSSVTRPAKPAAEQVPDSKILTAALHIVPGTSTNGAHSVTITDPAKIAAIAAQINALPTLPTYPKVYCPMIIDGPYLVLVFRDSASGPVLAQVRLTPHASGECSGGVQVTVNGATQPQLDDSGQPKLYAELLQSTGVNAR